MVVRCRILTEKITICSANCGVNECVAFIKAQSLIIRRYLTKEIVITWMVVVTILFLIFFSNRVMRYLTEAAAGAMSNEAVMTLVAIKSLASLPTLLPLALFIAVLVTLGRLYNDNEMVALAACGVGVSQIMRAVFGVSLFISGLLLALTLYVLPQAQQWGGQVEERARANADFSELQPGRFREIKGSGLVFYTETISADGKQLENIFARHDAAGVIGLLTAARAFYARDNETGQMYIIFGDGYRYEGVVGQADFRIIHFEEHGVRLQQRVREAGFAPVSGRSTALLWGSGQLDEIAELQWRMAMPISTLFLALLAVVLSKTAPRQGRFSKLFVALLIYVIYNNLMGIARNWLEQGDMPTAVGLWWVHGLLLCGFFGLWLQQVGLAWFFTTLRRRG